MTKFKNIFAVLFMFLQALSVFAAKKDYGIKVAVARVVNDSNTAPENEPSYKQTAVFKNLNPNSSLYSLQTSEFLLGEEVQGEADKARGECYVSFDVLGGKIPLKYLEKKLFFSYPYCNLVTIMPLVTLKILKENDMTISMGTSLYSPDENETYQYFHYPKNADELRGNNQNYIVMLTPERIGCIPKDKVCKIDDLRRLTIQEKRINIIKQARKLLGQPYQWGGRAALPGHGYDCAALVQIAYLTGTGERSIPRAVFKQADYGKEIKFDELEPGDLLFTLWHWDVHTDAIHVMIWVGDNRLIEASPISMTVREASIEDVFYGCSLNDIKNGQKFFANEKMRSVQFRRFL